jgi:hypothetical protein
MIKPHPNKERNKYVYIGKSEVLYFIENNVYDLLLEFVFECDDFVDMSGDLLDETNGRRVVNIFDFDNEFDVFIKPQKNITDTWEWVKNNFIPLANYREQRMKQVYEEN